MKQAIILEIIRELKSNPALRRKAKIFGGVALVVLIVGGGLTLWAGISIINHLGSTAGQLVTSPKAQEQIGNLKSELQQLQVQPASCLEKAQSLIAIDPWIENTITKNFLNLKTACLEPRATSCEGANCNPMNDREFKTEGRFI